MTKKELTKERIQLAKDEMADGLKEILSVHIKEKEISNEEIEKISKESNEKFKDKNLNNLLKKQLCTSMIGNEKTILLVFISACSTQMLSDDRISTKIKGITTGGKTRTWKTVLNNIPHDWFSDTTRFTRATMEDDLQTIGIYGGELEKNENKPLTEAVKQYSEDGMKVFKKARDEKGNWKPVKIIKERGVVIYTTTSTDTQEEEDSRFISVNVDSNSEIWGEVNKNTLSDAEDLEKQIGRYKEQESLSWIAYGLAKLEKFDIIIIPFSNAIEIKSDSARTQRDLKRFLSMIKIFAWLNQNNRPKETIDGLRVLYALPCDFYWTVWMSSLAFKQSITGLDDRLRTTYTTIEKLSKIIGERLDDAPNYMWVNRARLQAELKIKTVNTIRDYCNSLYDKGYISQHTGRGGSRNYVSTENILQNDNPEYHPLFRYSIDVQYKRIVDFYKEKYGKKFDIAVDLVLPISEKGMYILDTEQVNSRSIAGQLIGNNNNIDRYNTIENDTTYHENKETSKGNANNNDTIYIDSETLIGQISQVKNPSLVDKIRELKEYCEKIKVKGQNNSYDNLCYNFVPSFVNDCIQVGLLIKLPNGSYDFLER